MHKTIVNIMSQMYLLIYIITILLICIYMKNSISKYSNYINIKYTIRCILLPYRVFDISTKLIKQRFLRLQLESCFLFFKLQQK